MSILLDTNVISETIKKKPAANVLEWLKDQNPLELYLSAITVGELMRGADRAKLKTQRQQFTSWIENDLQQQFAGRILAFDNTAAGIWGRLMAAGDNTGKTCAAADAQIAAIAIQHKLTLATRNTKDFIAFDMELINPWD